MNTETVQIANIIREQITTGVLMSLGARSFTEMDEWETRRGGLDFHATILPMRKDGTRGTRARTMRVWVELAWNDTYTVKVFYTGRDWQDVTHFQRDMVYADQLPKLLLALDYDGNEILNPRLSA